MNLKKWTITFLLTALVAMHVQAAGTYYDYTDPSSTRKTKTWVPDNLTTVRGILLNGNGSGGDVTAHATHLHKQAFCEKNDFIIVATGFFYSFSDGMGGNDWNALMGALTDAATRSGHAEITNAPFVNYGFSNGGQMAYNLAYLIPDRTIAFCANKGGYYITETNGPIHVPGILIAGEVDAGYRREGISNLYVNGRAQGAPWAWLEEENVGHAFGNSEALLFAFYNDVIQQRYPTNLFPTATTQPTLLNVVETNGWLVSQDVSEWESGFSTIQPSAGYAGDKLQLGWVPSEKIAQLYRAAASFDRSVSTSFSSYLKPIVTRFPGDPLGYSTGELYYPGQPVHYEFDIAPSITDWQKVEIFDGTNKLTEVTDNSTNTVGADVILDATQGNNSLHTILTLSDNSKRVSHVSMLQSDTLRTPSIPDGLTASDATNGVATPVNNQTFSWTRPTNVTSVLGYSYALNEEPDETTEGTGTSATYTSLADGTHTFKVRAQSTSGVWGPSASFDLLIQSIGTVEVSTNSLSVDEGGTASFDVTMSGPSSSSVTLSVTRISGDTDLSVSGGSSLVFTAGTWASPQPVTLAAAQDSDADNGSAQFFITGPGIAGTTVTATEADDEIGILTSVGALAVPEDNSASFDITLSRAPSSSTTVSVAKISGDTDLSVSGSSSFVFTSNDWNIAQAVTLAAADDVDQIEGSAVFECRAPDALSAQITATETENDFSIVATGLLAAWNLDSISATPVVTEADAYFMATGLVQSVLTHSNPSEMRGASTALKAIDNDEASIGDAITAGNYFYWQIEPQSNYLVTVTSIVVRTDTDAGKPTEAFVLSDASGIDASSTLIENSTGIQLGTADLSGQSEFELSSAPIEFRVYGYKDNSQYTALYIGTKYYTDGLGDILVYGRVAYTSGGATNPVPPVSIQVSTNSISINEGGNGDVNVALSSAPAQTATVTVARLTGSTNLTVSAGASLTFTTSNWDQAQTVTVSAAQDADFSDESATFLLSGDGVSSTNLTVIAIDDDEPVGGSVVNRWLVDVGAVGGQTTGNWNNYYNVSGNGIVLSNLIDTNGTITTVDLWSSAGFSGDNTAGVNDGSLYPATAQNDSLYLTGTGGVGPQITQNVIRVEGLNTGYVYNVTLFGSRDTASLDRKTRFVVNGVTNYLQCAGNTTNTAVFTNIPASSGSFDITMAPYDESGTLQAWGYLGVIDLTALTPPDTGSEEPDVDTDGIPDDWEIIYFGGATNANPSATASNSVNTVMQCYIAGISPIDPSAKFQISDFRPLSSVLSWNAASGRVYSVYWTSNLLSSFQPLETNLTGGAYTDLLHGAESEGFYRIDVQLAP